MPRDEYVVHKEEALDGALVLKILPDHDPVNPREDYDHVGRMVCFHSRMDLGDEVHYDFKPGEPTYYFNQDYEPRDPDKEEYQNGHYVSGRGKFKDCELAAAFAAEVKNRGGVVLLLQIYDHSGVTMYVTSDGTKQDRWDSSNVGFIYVTAEKVKGEWGDGPDAKEKAESCLKAEVTEYDKYLRGTIYGYQIEDADGDPIESCWGIYGDDEAKAEGQSALKSILAQREKDHTDEKEKLEAFMERCE